MKSIVEVERMGCGGMMRISIPLLKKHLEEGGKALTLGESAGVLGMSPSAALGVLLIHGGDKHHPARQAEKEVYDLRVMGSRGIGGIEGWIFGSTSRRVVDSCKKPVLIIKLSRDIVGVISHGFGF